MDRDAETLQMGNSLNSIYLREGRALIRCNHRDAMAERLSTNLNGEILFRRCFLRDNETVEQMGLRRIQMKW